MKRLIYVFILALCTSTISAKTFLVDSKLSSAISDELLAQHDNDGGTYALYNGKFHRIGKTSFRSLKEFADNQTTCGVASGDTLYVAPGVYTESATINVEGLTILGHNANRDWTTTRDALESELQAILYIEANNITVNGFRITKDGRIMSKTATNSAPIKNLRVIYNKFENSTVKRDWGYQVVCFGTRAANATANNVSSQLRYLDCEVAHNHFYYPAGTTTTFPSGIDICGAGGNTYIHDNYFNSGGTSVAIENAQGIINIKNNVFKNVGKDTWTASDGGAKGDFAIYLERCAFANSTTANIQDNEFDGCTGQATLAPIIRVWAGTVNSTNFVTPVNYNININRNTFKRKTTIITSEIMTATNGATDQAGENLILYQDNQNGYDNTRYNIQDNHYDNRFYKYAWIRLNDGMPRQEIYANNFSEFKLGGSYSSFGDASWTTGAIGSAVQKTNITDHAAWNSGTHISHYEDTFIQSFDIDMETGDLYFIQDLNATEGGAMAKKYGASHETEECLILTRVPCTKPALPHTADATRRGYQYGTSYESMKIFRAGHGVKLSIVRDKDGQLWMLTGSKGTTRTTSKNNTLSGNAVAKFKFVNGAQVILDGRTTAHSADLKWNELDLSYIDHPIAGLNNVYGTVDELSRYFCFSSSITGQREYCIYDLDDILERKANPRLIKRITIKCGSTANAQKCAGSASGANGEGLANFKAADKGFETWSYQSYAISGDYLYLLEGTGPNSGITKGDPTIIVSVYNWRSGQFLNRTRIDYGRTNSSYGEPEGIVVRPDIYGNSTLYLGLVDGTDTNVASIYKYHINRYIQHFDNSDGYSTLTYRISGDDLTETSTHFDASQYPAIEFSHAITSDNSDVTCSESAIDFGTLSDATPRTAVVTISNAGEYRYGQWVGTITGADGGQFKVDVSDNEQFQTSTVTATVTFTPDLKKREYNASLRLHSPLATTNEESNDIVILLKATYTGEIVCESAPNRPHIETYQVTETTNDGETLYSFNLAMNAKLPDEYDNAYLAYTSYENGSTTGTTEILPFRQLIDHYVVEIDPNATNTLTEDQVTHLTIGEDKDAQHKVYANEIGNKKVNNVYVIESYTEGNTTYEASKSTYDIFVNEMTIPNAIQVNLDEASDTRQDESANYTDFEQVYSKPIVFHNVDPNKNYSFKVFLSGNNKYADAWQALRMDYYDGSHADHPYYVAGGYKSPTMVVPGTMYNHLNINVSDVDVPKGMETPFNEDRALSAMPMGVAKNRTNSLVTDPIHFTKANMISSTGYFNRLHVTDEVLNNWDVNYNMNIELSDNDKNSYGTYNFTYPISSSGNGESIVNIGEVNDNANGNAASISYLPIKIGEKVIVNNKDVFTKSVASYNQPNDSEYYTIKPTTNVNYMRIGKNSDTGATYTITGSDNQQEITLAQDSEPSTDIIVNGISELSNVQTGNVYLFHKKNNDYYYYDAISTVKWSAPDGLPVHGIGYFFDNGYNANPDACTYHDYIYNRGGFITTTKPVLASGTVEGFELLDGFKKLSENTRIYTDVDVFHYEYNDSNNWSQIAAEQRLLPIHINHIYDNQGERITNYSVIPSIKGTITAEYPFLFYNSNSAESYSPVVGISHAIGGTEVTEYSNFEHQPSSTRSSTLSLPTMLTVGSATSVELSMAEAIPTGIENISNDNYSFNIYPNPTTDYVNITSDDTLGCVEIYSIDGQLMECVYSDATNAKIDVSALASGTYILRIANQSTLLIKR